MILIHLNVNAFVIFIHDTSLPVNRHQYAIWYMLEGVCGHIRFILIDTDRGVKVEGAGIGVESHEQEYRLALCSLFNLPEKIYPLHVYQNLIPNQ